MGGRLEHEIRLLPRVLSCSLLTDDYVVVLIDPSADPRTIQHAVEQILQNAGSQAAVRVIGPPEATASAATHAISPFVATAAVATVAAMGVGALVGGLTAVDHPKNGPTRARALGVGVAAPFDSVDALRGLQNVHLFAPPAARLPVKIPDHTLRVLPVSFGPTAEAVSLVTAMPPTRQAANARAAGSTRKATDLRSERRGQKPRDLGKGPRPWSRSSHLRSHPGAQRGRDR